MIALVPLKGLQNGKSRLSSILGEEARRRLSLWMMERVLSSLKNARSVKRIILISKNAEARRTAESLGVETFEEKTEHLNGALNEAIQSLVAKNGASDPGRQQTILIVPADLPLLTSEEVDELVALSDAASPCVVAAPSRRGEGTNALLLHPAGILSPAFGPDSFNRHSANAQGLGIRFLSCRSTGTDLDIDLPEDLEDLRRSLAPEARDALSALLSQGPVVST
jgi:2-phospho-L-lactate guanylyltransferase